MTLQLRTFLHELLHALNRDHTDAAQMGDGRLTLEAPMRAETFVRLHEFILLVERHSLVESRDLVCG